MAEALLKDKVVQRGLAGQWMITSAGTWADPDLPATALAQAEMARRGLDIGAHRARLVEGDMLDAASLVVVMTHDHRESLCAEFPETAHKIVLFSELAGQTFDIADPVAGTAHDYELCADEMDRLLEEGFEKLSD